MPSLADVEAVLARYQDAYEMADQEIEKWRRETRYLREVLERVLETVPEPEHTRRVQFAFVVLGRARDQGGLK